MENTQSGAMRICIVAHTPNDKLMETVIMIPFLPPRQPWRRIEIPAEVVCAPGAR